MFRILEEELHSFRKSNAERMCNLIIEGRANVRETLDKDEYYYIISDDNYVLKHKGDTVTLIDGGIEVAKKITREEFNEGVKRLARENMKSKRGD